MQKTSISPIDVCVTNYKSRKSREKVDPSIVYVDLDLECLHRMLGKSSATRTKVTHSTTHTQTETRI